MRKLLLIITLFFAINANAQIVNRFRDSTWFAKSVRFDSAIYLIKGASNGKVLTSDAYGRATWQTFSGSGVTQGTLDDSILSVRNIRKVDTIYRNLDSIVFSINGERYAILDSLGSAGSTDSTIFATKNYVNSLNGSNATKTNLNDSTSALNTRINTKLNISDTIAQNLGIRTDYINSLVLKANQTALNDSVTALRLLRKVDSSYLSLNAGLDSLVFTNIINGIKYRTSTLRTASGGSIPISGLTAATANNTIDNGAFTQEWNWNTLAGGIGLKIASNSTLANGNTNTLLAVEQSGINANATQTTYGAKITNNKTGVLALNIGLQVNVNGGGSTTSSDVGSISAELNGKNEILRLKGTDFAYLTNYVGGVLKSKIGHSYSPDSKVLQIITNAPDSPIYLGTNNVNYIAIENNRLGINTNPIYPLHVRGTPNNGRIAYFEDGNIQCNFNSDYAFHHLRAGILGSFGLNSSGTLILQSGLQNQLGISNTNNNVGIGTLTPVASAKLEISSTTQGFLPPRMTTTQKNTIATPLEGLEVYDLTLHQKSYYNGTIWINY